MSETLKTLFESLLMTGVISAGFVWYAVVAARREDRETQTSAPTAAARTVPAFNKPARSRAVHDPDAHLGRCGAE